jgi:ribose 5-phosphate isomerase A
MVELASKKFVCIVDDTKMVTGLGGSKLAMPVEVTPFCYKYNLERLQNLPETKGCVAKVRLRAPARASVRFRGSVLIRRRAAAAHEGQ